MEINPRSSDSLEDSRHTVMKALNAMTHLWIQNSTNPDVLTILDSVL